MDSTGGGVAPGNLYSSHGHPRAAILAPTVAARETKVSGKARASAGAQDAGEAVTDPNRQELRNSDFATSSYFGYSLGSWSCEPPSSDAYADKGFIDLEAPCDPWICSRDEKLSTWLPSKLFGSKIQRKSRNPGACDTIGYKIRATSPLYGFIWKSFGFFGYNWLISLYHRKLGLICADAKEGMQGRSLALIWAETLVSTGICFLLAQGYYGMRASRERMERVRQTAVTLAYSFVKTTNVDKDGGYTRHQMQYLIYECLALLTAYPVALLHQMRGNTCEPAVTRYCQEVARALQRLRNGEEVLDAENSRFSFGHGPNRQHMVNVDYFFEVFSLHLEMEFRRPKLRTKTPSMTSQHIIYNLRNHFENIVDWGNLDDRRTPIIRENIDMLAMAGRECSIFAVTDVIPLAFLWAVDLSCRLLSVATPVQNCDWLVNATDRQGFRLPIFSTVVSMVGLATISSALLTVVDEMWRMWDPFGRGINTYAWSLGIASEIDNMLNEFYEHDTKTLVRKHGYMEE